MIQVCMKHIVSHILYGLSLFLVSRDICLLCDYEMSICLKIKATFAPSEDRTHDLEIMRLTRCLLRHRGS